VGEREVGFLQSRFYFVIIHTWIHQSQTANQPENKYFMSHKLKAEDTLINKRKSLEFVMIILLLKRRLFDNLLLLILVKYY